MASAATRRLKAIEDIDELAQAAVVAAIEAEGNAWEVQVLVVFALFRGGLDWLDLFAGNDVFEIFVQAFDGVRRGRVLETNHQQFVNKAHRVVIAIKTRNQAHGVISI